MSELADKGNVISAAQLGAKTKACSQYAIIGQYAADDGRFVKHVSLLRQSVEVKGGSDVNVWHTGPPIVSGPLAQSRFGDATCVAHVAGDFMLGPSECDAIANFLADVDKYHRTFTIKPLQQYVIVPHHQWVRAKETNRRIRRRFSCAGFVIEAYAAAAIDLIDLEQLPLARLEQVEFAFPDFRRLSESNERVQNRIGFRGLEDLGLTGEGPWPIALPGYLFHACDREQSVTEFSTFVVSSLDLASFPTP